MIKLLFSILHPKKGTNFISRKYNKLLHEKGIDEMNRIMGSTNCDCNKCFELHGGGGNVIISQIGSMTGKSFGFSVNVVSEYAYMFGNIRGVLGMSDAKKIAEHILSECKKNGKTEGDNLRLRWKDVIENKEGRYDDSDWAKFREDINKIK